MKSRCSTDKNSSEKKRTSLMPTIRKNRNRKRDKSNQLEKTQSNMPDNSTDGNTYNNSSDNIRNQNNKNIEYFNKQHNENNIIEKVTIKNTTTKSIETRTPDGYYTNATQSDESLEEYTRYENNKPRNNFYDDVIDIYPSYNETKPTQNDSKPKINSRHADTALLENPKSRNMDVYIEAVKQDGLALKYVDSKYRNKMIELIAVRQNGLALQYIDAYEQSENICLEAVRQNGLALKYVKDQKFEICKEAIRENWLAFHMVLDKNYDVCLEAVKQNGFLLQYIKNQDKRICEEAVNQNPQALEFVLSQDEDICRKALYKSGICLQYVENKTPELCLLAIQQNTLAIKYIPIEILDKGLDLKDYVFIYSNKHVIVNSIKEVRNLRQIYVQPNEDGYLIINALSQSNYPTSFVLQKDNIYVDDDTIDILSQQGHFVAIVKD